MAGSGGGASSNPSPAPKILLAKSGLVASGKFNRGSGGGGADEDCTALRTRLPPVGSLNLLSDSWDLQIDRFLPFLTDNTDFTVVGVIGPPGVEKSTILNEVYGFDSSSPVIVVSEGVHDASMWRLMLTVDLLKHGIPDPSSVTLSHPQTSTMSSDREIVNKPLDSGDEYIASPIFVHTRVQDRDITPFDFQKMRKALAQCFSTSSFIRSEAGQDASKDAHGDSDTDLKLFLVPYNKGNKDEDLRPHYESYFSVLSKLRDQVLSTSRSSFRRTVSERDWLKNSAKIWELVKNSPTIADYCKTLQSSGLYRK